jgi:hypothetical protein
MFARNLLDATRHPSYSQGRLRGCALFSAALSRIHRFIAKILPAEIRQHRELLVLLRRNGPMEVTSLPQSTSIKTNKVPQNRPGATELFVFQ